MKYLLYIFYVEILISILSAVQALFMPAVFLKQFSSEAASTLAIEMTRWYGVLLVVILFLLVQGLRLRGSPLKLALQALLVGDVLQIGVTFVTANALGGWSTVLVIAAGLSLFYLIIRAICLWKPVETGVER